MKKKAIIIGAGPAGLTAAYELLQRTDIIPVILEKSGDIGGISKTVNYKGNRIDIGGHRFFSKSDRVMKWWLNIMPLEQSAPQEFVINYQNKSILLNNKWGKEDAFRNNDADNMMLLRKRLSRIYFLRKFFTYPIQLSIDTLRKLGITTTLAILFSYLKAQLFPRKPETSLEDFMINRFGVKLYHLFFKDYTEKVWGVPCNQISSEWGAQRIKGVSISKAVKHAITQAVQRKKKTDLAQKDTETSLIEQFLYPKFGPGQLWEEVARQVVAMGGEIHLHQNVEKIYTTAGQVSAVSTTHATTGEKGYYEGEYFFSTMPVKELIEGIQAGVPATVKEVAAGLQYRDFITVGVLLRRLENAEGKKHVGNKPTLPDTWIYIQEKDVRVGRLQIFNNWSPYMVKDPDTVWIGMEYFCNKGDGFWELSDRELQRIGVTELEKMGLAKVDYVLDTTVIRMENTYPAYFGTYTRFDEVRAFTDTLQNLFLVGRNGMHKYNNSDHSMLTAMVAVDNIVAGVTDKENVWSINTEQEYHEEKKGERDVQEKKEQQGIRYKVAEKATGEIKKTFKHFLWHNRFNKRLLLMFVGVQALLFLVFKYFYPYIGFVNGDSYAYLNQANLNPKISFYPVGYPGFLRLLSVFSTSGSLLAVLQYAMLCFSGLYFLFTCFYLFRLNRGIRIALLVLFVANPVYLYLANYVLSDSLFIAVSIVWFTSLLWIINQATRAMIILHTIAIFVAFTIRNNALYYPLISCLAFFLANSRPGVKLAGVFFSVVLIGTFIQVNRMRYKQLTGFSQFTPFSGWQLANNAMYAYRYVDARDRKPVPVRFRELDGDVRNYFDSSRDVNSHPTELLQASTLYMWSSFSPLQYYMKKKYAQDNGALHFRRWATVGPLYADYGRYLIQQYPKMFWKYYLVINFYKYYTPPVEFLGSYNLEKDSVLSLGRSWFGYPTTIHPRGVSMKVSVLQFHPVLCGVLGGVYVSCLLGFLGLGLHKKHTVLAKTVLLSAVFYMLNLGFSVLAAPIALRFQLFPVMIYLPFIAVTLREVIKAASTEKQLSLQNEPVLENKMPVRVEAV